MTRARVLTLLVEVLIGLAMVTGVYLYAEFGPFSWMPSARWWGLAGITALLFWLGARRYRVYWRRRGFWLALARFLTLHLSAWTLILIWVPGWPLFWFAPAVVLEAAPFVWVLDRAGFHPAGMGSR